MPPGIGYSYQPGAGDQRLRPGTGGAPETTVPQQAIRTLSLRVPQTQSVRGLAPLPLLTAQGGGGSDLDMLLKALLAAFGGGKSGATAGGGRQAAPRIIPGVDDPTEPKGPIVPAALEAILRAKSGGRGGIGDTGRGPMGRPVPAPVPAPAPGGFDIGEPTGPWSGPDVPDIYSMNRVTPLF